MSLKEQLIDAINSGYNQKVSDVLVQMNIEEVNEKNVLGETVLHGACLWKNNRAMSILLAKPGINVNAKNRFGLTPLHVACLHNNHEAVDQLLGCPGIEENAKNNDGCTPIMNAAKLCRKKALAVMLGSPRVDLDLKDNGGRGLEESVGLVWGGSNDKKKCLVMIQEERTKRKNMLENEKQKSGEESRVGIGIENIERINKKIEDGEQRWKENLDNRKLKRRELDERQSSELERIAKKHRIEKSALEETFDREDEDNERYMASLKEIRKDLAQDIEKNTNELSNDERGKLEAAREMLECPVCMEIMKPPTRIWMCRLSHVICEACNCQLIRVRGPHPPCPTCKSERVSQRAIIAEKFAESVFKT